MNAAHPLSQTVGALMRHADAVSPEDSLSHAAAVLRESAAAVLPIVDGHVLIGVVTERKLAETLAMGLGELTSVSGVMETPQNLIDPFATGAEALRRFGGVPDAELLVVDDHQRLLGVISASDLYTRYGIPPGLPMVGGMATPFGVYLTAGGIRAGAGDLALVTTGMMLFTIFLGTQLAGEYVADWMSPYFGWAIAPDWLVGAIPLLLFMATIRLLPLSGTHAAEHKTVHAMERGEPLEIEVVRRMPRVHPRCGTNLAVGISLFLGLAGWKWIEEEQIRLLVAAVVTMFVWRPFGSLIQQYVTTRPPNDRQLMSGIRAGKELVEKFRTRPPTQMSLFRRILSSGMLHVMGGSLLMATLCELLAQALGFRLLG